ncbi:hypothetical protein ACFL23_02040 [Patescibacteria group bacterium]
MPSTEEQVKDIISQNKGKAHKYQIARELKISLDYVALLCRTLERKGEVIFSDGFCSFVTSDRKSKARTRSSSKSRGKVRLRSRSKKSRRRSRKKVQAKVSVHSKSQGKRGTPNKSLKTVTSNLPNSSIPKNIIVLETDKSLGDGGDCHQKSHYRKKKLRQGQVKQKTSIQKPETKSPLFDLPVMSEEIINVLEKAGYRTIEALSEAPVVKLIQETQLKLHEAAILINQSRERLNKIGE